MADPLSIAASVIALGTAAIQVQSLLRGFMEDYKGCPEELEYLDAELGIIGAYTSTIHQKISSLESLNGYSSQAPAMAVVQRYLVECMRTFRELEKLLNQARLCSGTRRRQISWVIATSQRNKLQKKLQDDKLSLLLVQSMLGDLHHWDDTLGTGQFNDNHKVRESEADSVGRPQNETETAANVLSVAETMSDRDTFNMTFHFDRIPGLGDSFAYRNIDLDDPKATMSSNDGSFSADWSDLKSVSNISSRSVFNLKAVTTEQESNVDDGDYDDEDDKYDQNTHLDSKPKLQAGSTRNLEPQPFDHIFWDIQEI
jgi:hypothetical protein